jgi:proline dehydrogenase
MLNKFISKIIALLPENIVWIFSKRYIAGKKISDAIRVAKKLNQKGIETTIDVLGEYIQKINEAKEYKKNYLNTIQTISKNKIKTSLSVKPSMFGLLLDEEFCYLQLQEVVKKAQEKALKVCLDMEDSTCTQIELSIFERLYKEFPDSVTLVLQAYLYRTLNDLKWLKSIMLPEYPINVRLCKGIYIESAKVAYKQHKAINKNYIVCADYMLNNGFFSALATHDKKLIDVLTGMLKQKKIGPVSYEFQMLFGVRPHLRDKLIKNNHPMRVYVPFGTHWYGYSTRRLKENPRIITHIIKALIVRG